MKKIKLAAFIMLIPLSLCKCEILHVPSEYPTIQAAIDAATELDTVLVSEGIYYENISYKGKKIVIASNYIFSNNWQTVLNTIINGSSTTNKDSASVVRFLNNEDSWAVLEGFTITGGSGTNYEFSPGNRWQEGAGIILSHSSAIIRNNIIINNGVVPVPGIKDGGGGGIASMYGNPTIYNNVIVSNNAGYAGGIVLNWSGGKIRNNIVYHNTGRAAWGTGGVMLWDCPANSAFLENNTIVGNISLKDAGGININTSSNVIKNNIVWGNRQVTGKQVLNPQRGSYNNIEDFSNADNISNYPMLLEDSFFLEDNSPCIDAGDPDLNYIDNEDALNPGKALLPSKGNLTNDIGAFGGEFAKILGELNIRDLWVNKKNVNLSCDVLENFSTKIALLNLSSVKIRIDSVIHTDTSEFKISYSGELLNLFQSDTLDISFSPLIAGIKIDTISVYYNNAEGPLKIIITGKANPVGVLEPENSPAEYAVYQNYPNPFNPSTRIKFSLGTGEFVSINIYDILGNRVAELINEEMNPGLQEVIWTPGNSISSGIYFFHLLTPHFSGTKKMIFQK